MMLRFLTDEDFDGRVTSGLLARFPNLDFVRVQDVGLMSTPDDAILEWAGKPGRIVLTHDRNTMTKFAGDRIQAGAMSGHRKRVKRCNIPGHAHELTFSCFRRLPWLGKDRTRQWFVDAMETTRKRRNLAIWAYVIMPEHVHFG